MDYVAIDLRKDLESNHKEILMVQTPTVLYDNVRYHYVNAEKFTTRDTGAAVSPILTYPNSHCGAWRSSAVDLTPSLYLFRDSSFSIQKLVRHRHYLIKFCFSSGKAWQG